MYKNTYNLHFGTDPEVFLVDDNETAVIDGTIEGVPFAISPAASADIYGFKEQGGEVKHPIYFSKKDFKIIGDGVAYEINLFKPYYDPREMWQAVQDSISFLEDNVGKFGLSIYKKPVVNFNCHKWWKDKYMKDERYFWSTVFGCDKDYDALNMSWSSEIENAAKHPIRYGGGHLHISGIKEIDTYILPYVKLLAILVGNYCLCKSRNPELEKERAIYYGKPCKYRPQEYKDGVKGVEYRTPSNSWLGFSYPEFEYIFELIDMATSCLENKQLGRSLLNDWLDPTIDAISKGSQEDSKFILESIGVL